MGYVAANGALIVTGDYGMDYDAFGNQWTGTAPDPFGYCGEYLDDETGLIYLRNRYYDSSTGRFITEDPAKDGLNWYSYCGGDPVMFVDPTGYITEEEQEMYENGEMALGAYSFLMVCTYYYYLSDTQEGKNGGMNRHKTLEIATIQIPGMIIGIGLSQKCRQDHQENIYQEKSIFLEII